MWVSLEMEAWLSRVSARGANQGTAFDTPAKEVQGHGDT